MTTEMTIFFGIVGCIVIGVAMLSSQMKKTAYQRAYDRIVNTIDNKQILNVWVERRIRVRRNDFNGPTIRAHDVLIIETVDTMSNEVNKERFLLTQLRVKYKTNMAKLISRDYSKEVIYLSYEKVKTKEEIQVR